MVKLTVYSSEGDFDLSGYFDVSKRSDFQNQHYYTNTDIVAATLYSFDTDVGSRTKASPLYFGHATLGDGYGFDADGRITGMIGDEKLSTWLAGRDLADYTPETLLARVFVGDDQLRGNLGNDTLDGYAGDDHLLGGGGNDTLMGNVGDDVLLGGFGDDTLTGGFGADRFVYREIHDIIRGDDFITDFSHADGDKIDLTTFDAKVSTPEQDLPSFIGQDAFSANGGGPELRVEVVSDTVNVLQFDTNGDGTADAQITVYTNTVLDASDFYVAPTTDGAARVDMAAFGPDHVAVLPILGGHSLHAELATGHLA